MAANAALEILIWSGQAGKDSGGKLQRDYSKMTDEIPLLDCNAANAPFNRSDLGAFMERTTQT